MNDDLGPMTGVIFIAVGIVLILFGMGMMGYDLFRPQLMEPAIDMYEEVTIFGEDKK